MKSEKNSIILLLSLVISITLTLGSCGDSGKPKTESANQEIAVKDSSANTAAESRQPAPATENAPGAQKVTSSEVKEGVTTKNTGKTSGATTAASKPQISATDKKIQPAEKPISNPVSPVDEPVVKEVTKPSPAKPVVITQPAPVATAKAVVSGPASWIVPAKDKNKANPVKTDVASLSTGKSLYLKHCASCHGKSGLGDGAKAAMLKTSSGNFELPVFQNQTDGAIFYKIREGKNEMPAYGKKIPDDEDIWSIVNYIRKLK